MKRTLIAVLFVILASSSLIAAAPRPAHAQWAVIDFSNLVKNTITSAMTSVIAGGISALQIKEYILDPIAWTLAQNALQSITGSVISFVNGGGNGVGQSQFVQNLPGYLTNVGDNQAVTFFTQFVTNSNSPFAAAITSSLRTSYLQNTSDAGYLAANQCTLTQSSPNTNAFLAGDWSQGGAGEWFALTTNTANNPYILHQSAQEQQRTLVSTAQNSQAQQLAWGQGTLGWCGTGMAAAPGTTPVQCLNADGTSGTIHTPGAVIMATLNHSLQLGSNKLVAADELSEIIGQLAMNLVSSALGGASGGLTGLSGGGSSSYVSQFRSQTGSGSATANITTLVQQILNSISSYIAVQNAELGAAQGALANMQNVLNSCGDPFSLSQAQNYISTQINPVINTANANISTANTTRAYALQVQNEAATGSVSLTQLSADAQQLSTMTPTAGDTAIAQANQQTVIDNMNKLNTQASTLLSNCTPASSYNNGLYGGTSP